MDKNKQALIPSGEKTAFPFTNDMGDGSYVSQNGMNLRDYFAAKAMLGAISEGIASSLSHEEVADWAYSLADAMLKKGGYANR